MVTIGFLSLITSSAHISTLAERWAKGSILYDVGEKSLASFLVKIYGKDTLQSFKIKGSIISSVGGVIVTDTFFILKKNRKDILKSSRIKVDKNQFKG
ncbi:hypothetical protein IW492_14245, partial [Enterococcus sp. BWB1-3]|uniref:hypothetical protein n=1 Tax=Enterococcus sp. BWB1-3 TaxID=2787713 RepID=UPI0019242AC1